MPKEITYEKTGQSQRGRVQNYHCKPSPLDRSKAYKGDVAGLKSKTQREAVRLSDLSDEVASRFTIGFEIEKNQLHRGAVKEYELFCGFERDGSCGYEAVTHILPLLPAGKWRTKVFDMIHKAERIIDDRFSPSDNRCGGHITIGVDNQSGNEIMEKIRVNSGIILALFRKRLTNRYCKENNRLQRVSYPDKYSVALAKSWCLEFRLPSRFESVKQVMRRYELFYEIVNFTYNNPNGKHETLLKKVYPIVLSMYNGDEAKAKEIIKLAKSFRHYILTSEIDSEINIYI